MKKVISYNLSTLAILTVLNSSPTAYATDTSLKDAQKNHPDAHFTVNPSNGSYSYTYKKEHANQQATPSQKQPNNPVQTPTLPPSSPLQSTPPVTSHPSVAPSTPSDAATIDDDTFSIDKAYKKDETGMITFIDTDELFDELQITQFNDKAVTADGKPLAVGNGKIVDHAAFTSKNNLYTSGQCTWYVFDKRAKDGHTISTFWGDARHWANQAAHAGYKVNNKPAKGAIFQTGDGPYGHVAYVERINGDGSIFISEMNYIAPYITSTRTIPAAAVNQFNYIH